MRVTAPCEGALVAIDQVGLGNYVNFGLQPNRDAAISPGENGSGIILKKLLGATIRRGELIAEVLVVKASIEQAGGVDAIIAEVASYFRVAPHGAGEISSAP